MAQEKGEKMFIRDVNGYLVNANRIVRIFVQFYSESNTCAVVAFYINARNDEDKCTLYRDKELQYCQEYLDDLSRKISVNHNIWEN